MIPYPLQSNLPRSTMAPRLPQCGSRGTGQPFLASRVGAIISSSIHMSIVSKVSRAVKEGGITAVITRAFNKFLWSFAWQDYTRHTSHQKLGKSWPTTEVVYQGPQRSKEDAQIAKRIITALKLALKDNKKQWTGDLWDRIQDERHTDFFRVWEDPEKMAEYMNHMNERGITHGMGGGSTGSTPFKDKRVRNSWGVMMKDILVSFAEATGALPNKIEENLYMDEVTILGEIEDTIGIRVTSPQIDGAQYKYKVGAWLFDMKELWSAYTAWRIFTLVGRKASIAEIGGGIGKAAYYSSRFGFQNYSIFDLPMSNVIQAWYLIKSGEAVTLYGEEEIPGTIRIMPYWMFTPEQKYDITVNVDSFAEMDQSVVEGYLQTIKSNTSKYLLSINQEEETPYGDGHKHTVVPWVVKMVGGLSLVHRFPFWLSRRYVEELYTINK